MTIPWETPWAVPCREFRNLRRRVIFECCKWDPQLEDVGTLAAFPIILHESAWLQIAEVARSLYGETLDLERSLRETPEFWRQLSIPGRIRRALRRGGSVAPSLARVMRFDFHFTTDGWRVSEVNSDVPGGFIEASGFSSLMADFFPTLRTVGDPAAKLVDVIANQLSNGSRIGFVHATAYTDDRQVMCYLGRKLAARGFVPTLVSPTDLLWNDGTVDARVGAEVFPLSGLVRFFPAEWMPNLPNAAQWEYFFGGSSIPQANPGTAILSQSKRLPLLWDKLTAQVPVWKECLPESRDCGVMGREDRNWILKPALGRIGEGIAIPGMMSEKELRRMRRWSRWRPGHWIAQRRFEAVAMHSPDGPVFPCIGVFVIDGQVAGAYGRIARRALIDEKAQDAAVLYRPNKSP